MPYEAHGFLLDDSGYPAHHRAAIDKWLHSTKQPVPLHSWAEYNKCRQLLELTNTVITVKKLTPEEIKLWQDETQRVAMWEDKHFNHL